MERSVICLSSPCQNGATCINQENNYECDCVAGFTGRNCEININDCEESWHLETRRQYNAQLGAVKK